MLMQESLAFRMAVLHIHAFREESAHPTCLNTEALLKLGLDAYQWVTGADHEFRLQVLRDETDWNPEVEQSLLWLLRQWYETAAHERTAQLIGQCISSRPVESSLLERFKQCCVEAKATLSHHGRGEEAMPPALEELERQAVQEYRSGQTAEFLEG